MVAPRYRIWDFTEYPLSRLAGYGSATFFDARTHRSFRGAQLNDRKIVVKFDEGERADADAVKSTATIVVASGGAIPPPSKQKWTPPDN